MDLALMYTYNNSIVEYMVVYKKLTFSSNKMVVN